ncbi:hypothetical protein AVEN_215718-1 [Araneus ventricosus]|uniref:Uncharacterized protein n=1 Tax=Araneus ventricosus TaxID=182803 RepID=A0A4Y2QLI4_ARAVE|nr:hypothetical protein AVEN_215718-1 [Araneus ventricosus]
MSCHIELKWGGPGEFVIEDYPKILKTVCYFDGMIINSEGRLPVQDSEFLFENFRADAANHNAWHTQQITSIFISDGFCEICSRATFVLSSRSLALLPLTIECQIVGESINT